jgi:uncharacterized protein (DUF924 family)
MYQEVLQFWFEDTDPKMWWVADSTFDNAISNQFTGLLERAAQGELYAWRGEPGGRLAEIIVLDQFSRNIYRHTPQAFAQDVMALVLAQEAVNSDIHRKLSQTQSGFLLLPFMHSESKLIHVWGERLYREFAAEENYQFELKHKAIIDRFGRYPHRNEILGRTSSREEIEFLKLPGSSF